MQWQSGKYIARSHLTRYLIYLPCNAMHPGIGFIGTKSTPIIKLDIGICSFATCIHEPGAAHKSIHTLDFWRNSYFRFNCTNLNDARDLQYKLRMKFHFSFKIIVVSLRKTWMPYNNTKYLYIPVTNFLCRPISFISPCFPSFCLFTHF